jgi:hypothetical protein
VGQTRKLEQVCLMSACLPEADPPSRAGSVGFGPGRDMARAPKTLPKNAQRPRALTTFVQTQMAAAASKKAPPSATITSPGQFDFPKPLPGLSGSSVLGPERSRLLPLSRPRQIG